MPTCILCIAFVIRVQTSMKQISALVSILEATRQACVCNGTLHCKGNRYKYIASTHWSQQAQRTEDTVLQSVNYRLLGCILNKSL
jgi:hypothetical protein